MLTFVTRCRLSDVEELTGRLPTMVALGAHAVLIGRPYLWALTTGGADGVEQLFRQFRSELHEAITLTGCRRLADITRDLAVP